MFIDAPDKAALQSAIVRAFPLIDMAAPSNLLLKSNGSSERHYILNDLREMVGREPTAPDLRSLYAAWHYLSLEGWNWLLPRYLRHCLGEGSEGDQQEAQFLIFALLPIADRYENLAALLQNLNLTQVECLLAFLRWIATTPLNDDMACEITEVGDFLTQYLASGSSVSIKPPA